MKSAYNYTVLLYIYICSIFFFFFKVFIIFQVEAKKEASDVEKDIQIISSKVKNKAAEIDDDVEIISAHKKKNIDKGQLQTFMSNKVQSLLLTGSSGKLKKPETSNSLSNLRKNIALSMKKSGSENENSQNIKPRRGRKPTIKNQENSDEALNTSVKNALDNDEVVPEENNVVSSAADSSKLPLSKVECEESALIPVETSVEDSAQLVSSAVSSDNHEMEHKEKKLLEQLKIANDSDPVKVPAKRGRPPKKLEDKLREAAAVSKTIQKKIAVSNQRNLPAKNKDVTVVEVIGEYFCCCSVASITLFCLLY